MALRTLKGVKELRFVLCQSSAQSAGLRNYIALNYEAIRASSAQVTIRECANAVPIAIATYSFGREKKANLASLSQTEIDQAIAALQAYSQQASQRITL